MQVLFQGFIAPLIGVFRIRYHQGHPFPEFIEFTRELPDKHRQSAVRDIQRISGSDLAGDRIIVIRLSFLDIGDRDQAHFKPLLRLFQLATDGVFLSLAKSQGIFRGQHIKEGFSDSNDQILAGRLELCFGLGYAGVGLIQRNKKLSVKQHLPDIQSVGGGVKIGVERGLAGSINFLRSAFIARTQRNLGQQKRSGLRLGFARGEVVVLGGLECGVLL